MYYFTNGEMQERVRAVEEASVRKIKENKELERLGHNIKQDYMLQAHSKKVAELSTMIGIAYNLDKKSIIELCTGAYFHDIGKISLDSEVLYKKGIFTEDERSYTQTHTTIGRKLLEGTGVSEEIMEIAECHHKKLDGSGYPGPVYGDDIPLFAQIVTVADMFEAMTTDRCYRAAMDEQKVFKILNKDRGINQLAVKILEQNITTVRTKIYIYEGSEKPITESIRKAQ